MDEQFTKRQMGKLTLHQKITVKGVLELYYLNMEVLAKEDDFWVFSYAWNIALGPRGNLASILLKKEIPYGTYYRFRKTAFMIKCKRVTHHPIQTQTKVWLKWRNFKPWEGNGLGKCVII